MPGSAGVSSCLPRRQAAGCSTARAGRIGELVKVRLMPQELLPGWLMSQSPDSYAVGAHPAMESTFNISDFR